MSEPTLLRQLLDGVDPTTVAAYEHLFELLVEYPTWDHERRESAWKQARHIAEDGEPHVRQPGEVVGWESVDAYRACGRYELELLTWAGVREMFVAKLPAEERRRLEVRRRQVELPTFALAVDRGGAEACMTCGEGLGRLEWYLALWEPEHGEPDEGWIVCMRCAARALPVGMPLLELEVLR